MTLHQTLTSTAHPYGKLSTHGLSNAGSWYSCCAWLATADGELPSKVFARLSRAWQAECPLTALRAAWAAARCSSKAAERYRELCSQAAAPPVDCHALPSALMRSDLDAMERHVVGNTLARAICQTVPMSQLRRPDGEPAQIGFFAAGEPRNVLHTIAHLQEEKLRKPAGIGLDDKGLALLTRDSKAWERIGKGLNEDPLTVEVHLNDLNPPTLARDILLLLIASEHSPQAGNQWLDTALLYAAVSGHLVLYATQRRELDAMLGGLIDRSHSLADFEIAYPWLRICGDGRPGTEAALLRELRWVWLRWRSMETISVACLEAQAQAQREETLHHTMHMLSTPALLPGFHPQRTPYPDPRSRLYYFRHGMLPLATGLRAKLAKEYALEDLEREGGVRFVNPTLLCPYSAAVLDLNGPFATYRHVFQERQNTGVGQEPKALRALAEEEAPDERDSSAATREGGGGGRGGGSSSSSAHSALEIICTMLSMWLTDFAGALHYPSPMVVQRVPIWSGDCLSLARRMRRRGHTFDMMHTSNVIDYCGLLPLCDAFAPLLRGADAVLECEVMMGVAQTLDDFTKQALGQRAATLAPLLPLRCAEVVQVEGAMLLRFQAPVEKRLLVDRRVRIRGLAARPELNGQLGVVSAVDAKSGRCAVAPCDGGPTVSVRPERLEAEPEPCSTTDTALIRGVFEAVVGIERQVMDRGLHAALCGGRGIPAHTVHSLVAVYVRWCERRACEPPLPLDDCLKGNVGSLSTQQHRLALHIAAALHGGSSCAAFRHLDSLFLTTADLSWRTWQLSLKPAADAELSLVALLLTSRAHAALQSGGGTGRALERRVRATPPTELQVLDSVLFDPRAAVLRLLLPTTPRDLGRFFSAGGAGASAGSVAHGGEALSVVLLDVQNWQLLCEPASVCELPPPPAEPAAPHEPPAPTRGGRPASAEADGTCARGAEGFRQEGN